MSNLLSSNMFTGFDSLVGELGGNPTDLLTRFGLPADVEKRKDSYVSFYDSAMLFDYCAKTLNCPNFGMRLSRLQGLAVLGPVAVLARNTKNVESGLKSIGNYFHLITPATLVEFETKAAEDCVRAVFKIIEPGLTHTQQIYELFMGNGQLITHMLFGAEVYATRIHFPYSPMSSPSVYEEFFRCEIKFQQSECLVDMPMHVMLQQVSGADKETALIASRYLSEVYEAKPTNLSEQVRQLINKLLPTGHCRIQIVAEQLHLHPRTLQRKLAKTQHVFEDLVDTERKKLAQRYLAEPHLRLTQITGLLGYADQSALNRSCRRWFNKTPKQLIAEYRNF